MATSRGARLDGWGVVVVVVVDGTVGFDGVTGTIGWKAWVGTCGVGTEDELSGGSE